MTLAEQLSEKELKVLLNYKPKVIDLEALEDKIDRLGYSELLGAYGHVVDKDSFDEKYSKEVVSWLMEYISWHIKTKLFA